MVIARHVILSEVEESPVFTLVLNATHAVNTFARRHRWPFAFVSTTVREQAGACLRSALRCRQAHKGRPYTGNGACCAWAA